MDFFYNIVIKDAIKINQRAFYDSLPQGIRLLYMEDKVKFDFIMELVHCGLNDKKLMNRIFRYLDTYFRSSLHSLVYPSRLRYYVDIKEAMCFIANRLVLHRRNCRRCINK